MFFLLLQSALAWDSASTTAQTASGSVQITGLDGHAFHTHGGPAATVGGAQFRVRNGGTAPLAVTVRGVEFLTGSDCEAPPQRVKATPAFGGLFHDGLKESVKTLTLPPGVELELDVGFERVEAYYTYCSRFAFRVAFDVGGEAVTAVAETNVTREEPWRKP